MKSMFKKQRLFQNENENKGLKTNESYIVT